MVGTARPAWEHFASYSGVQHDKKDDRNLGEVCFYFVFCYFVFCASK